MEIEAPYEMNIRDLIHILCEKLGVQFKEGILDAQTGAVQRYIKIMVNGRDIESMNGLETIVRDQDIVQIFPPVGGGGFQR